MAKKPERTPTPVPSPALPELPERWSVQWNQEVVLRLLRGEPLGQVCRETQVPVHDLETWQRRFLEAGQRGVRTKVNSEELTLAKAKLAELMKRMELAEVLMENRGRAARCVLTRVQETGSATIELFAGCNPNERRGSMDRRWGGAEKLTISAKNPGHVVSLARLKSGAVFPADPMSPPPSACRGGGMAERLLFTHRACQATLYTLSKSFGREDSTTLHLPAQGLCLGDCR